MLASLRQRPLAIGIVAFPVTMMPEGLAVAVAIPVGSVVVATEGDRLQSLLASGSSGAGA